MTITTYGQISKSLAQWAADVPGAIEIGNEGEDGYWLFLDFGWVNRDLECSSYHEYTVADLKAAVRRTPPVVR